MAAFGTANLLPARNRILVASADPFFRRKMMKHLAYAEWQSEEAFGGAHALAKLLQIPCDSVLLDKNLPDLDAAEVASQIRKQFPEIAIQLLDSRGICEEAQDSEVREQIISTPQENESPANPFEGQREKRSGTHNFNASRSVGAKNIANATNIARIANTVHTVDTLPGMIGTSRAIREVYQLARMVAERDTTVLIGGETGTGKELVAKAIHQLSKRARQPFVVVNCAAIPEALLEAELFGYTRGAFTGAVQSRVGRIHVAQGGTLFLDEVGELPLSMQAKLLRFMQSGEVQRLGSSDVYLTDVRVICATNVELKDLAQAKQFRQDLYYRLTVFPVVLPPLRDRLEDIEVLAEHFLSELSAEIAVPQKYLSLSTLAYLRKKTWNGNVRELQHALERAFILSGNERELGIEHFRAFHENDRVREI